MRKRTFDRGWQLQINAESGALAMQEFSPAMKTQVDATNHYGLRSVWLNDGWLIIAGMQLYRLFKYAGGTAMYNRENTLSLLDMKNQAVVSSLELPLEAGNKILDFLVWGMV